MKYPVDLLVFSWAKLWNLAGYRYGDVYEQRPKNTINKCATLTSGSGMRRSTVGISSLNLMGNLFGRTIIFPICSTMHRRRTSLYKKCVHFILYTTFTFFSHLTGNNALSILAAKNVMLISI